MFTINWTTVYSRDYLAISRWRQCACVHFLSDICDHKQIEGCGRGVVGYCC